MRLSNTSLSTIFLEVLSSTNDLQRQNSNSAEEVASVCVTEGWLSTLHAAEKPPSIVHILDYLLLERNGRYDVADDDRKVFPGHDG